MIRLFFVFLLFLSACTEVKYEESSGGINEVLVVVDEKYNNKEIKKIINSNNEYYKGLPQKEKTLDITYIPLKSFKNIFKKQRCIIVLINSEKEFFRVLKEKWAGSQKVFYFSANNKKGIERLLQDKIPLIFKEIQEINMDCLFKELKTQHDKKIHSYVEEKLQISLYLPEGFFLNKENENSLWFLRESEKGDYLNNILVYTSKEKKLTNKDLFEIRDKKLKKFIETQEGSYMTTDKRYDVFFKKDTLEYFIENSFFGLWKLEGAIMGGPFYSKIIRDTTQNRVIFLESFLFYPNEKKRNMVIQNKTIIENTKTVKN